MPSALYVDAAAQVALARRLDSIAANIANATTPGYRADGVKFDSLVSATGGRNVAFPAAGRDYITTAAGPLSRTGGPLDLAVRGAGWFALQSPDGPVYTRDGRFEMATTGELRSVNGYPVLDASGAPISVEAAGGPIAIAGDGMISQRGRQVGAMGLFAFPPGADLTRYDNSSVIPDQPAIPVLDFVANGIVQGYVEQSNVNPVRELTRLIEVQRAFDNITASADMIDGARLDAIKTLGAVA